MCHSPWFQQLGEAVSHIVAVHGGAVVMTREGLKEAIAESHPVMRDCPELVLSHPTLVFNKFGLTARPFEDDRNILVIFDRQHFSDKQSAEDHCRREGLSPDVEIALRERIGVSA